MTQADLGLVFDVAGTALTTGYVAGAAKQYGNAKRVWFWIKNVRSNGSNATTTTIKLQARYAGAATLAYDDLPSDKGDANKTFEIEHAFTSTANATTTGHFFLDLPAGLMDVTVNVKVNATGQSGDETFVYATVG